jgi:hypothetical protein
MALSTARIKGMLEMSDLVMDMFKFVKQGAAAARDPASAKKRKR